MDDFSVTCSSLVLFLLINITIRKNIGRELKREIRDAKLPKYHKFYFLRKMIQTKSLQINFIPNCLPGTNHAPALPCPELSHAAPQPWDGHLQ